MNEYLYLVVFDWYVVCGIFLWCGYFFYGLFGIGQISYVFVIVGVFGLLFYVVNLGEVIEEDFQVFFVKLFCCCIVLLEDIDSVGFKCIISYDEVMEEYKEGSREDNKRKLRVDE